MASKAGLLRLHEQRFDDLRFAAFGGWYGIYPLKTNRQRFAATLIDFVF